MDPEPNPPSSFILSVIVDNKSGIPWGVEYGRWGWDVGLITAGLIIITTIIITIIIIK